MAGQAGLDGAAGPVEVRRIRVQVKVPVCRQQRALQLEGQLLRVAAGGQLSLCMGVLRRLLQGAHPLLLALGDALAAQTGWSRKRLWSRFRSQIGLTPKRAAQLVRFDHAAHRLAAGHSPALVAAESGYVDQSRLHRDVVAFAGLTPAAVAASPFLAVDVARPQPWRSRTEYKGQRKSNARLARKDVKV
jgi:AraC-like DNA-binding protein